MHVKKIKIALQLPPQYGDMKQLRKAWMEAEALGADVLYVTDHFHAQVMSSEIIKEAAPSAVAYGESNFEATMVQAAMAATTSRVEIGCLVHANSYRNPNLMADMARTIDHISGGRFILGMGAGYLKQDYDEYGYEFGTAKSRMENFARDLPIIKARFEKLNPPPLRKIPLMIAAMGESIGMPLVAEYGDIWHVYGEIEKIAQKCEVLKSLCQKIGRDFDEIELSTSYVPEIAADSDPDAYVALGFTQIIAQTFGPRWDLGTLREMLQWRNNLA